MEALTVVAAKVAERLSHMNTTDGSGVLVVGASDSGGPVGKQPRSLFFAKKYYPGKNL